LSASTVSPLRDTPIGAQRAASCSPRAALIAAVALESTSTITASGTLASSQLRHWAEACGWAAIERMPASGAGVRAASTNSTGSTTSRVMIRGLPVASSSSVTGTAPPTEFSSGTSAASASPLRTASSASGTLRAGVRRPRSAAGMVRSAASVKVPSGPR
jgi:hypothetical protein